MTFSIINPIIKKTIFLLCCMCAISWPAFAATELDGVVAIVNENVITQSQLNAMMFEIRRSLQATGAPMPSNSELRKKALDQLIAESLQMQIAARNNITVSDTEVNKAVANIAEQNHITVEQLKEALGKEGINYTKFRAQLHDQIILRQVQGAILGGKVTVSDAEARNYISTHPVESTSNNIQYHVDDLLIPVSESASSADIQAAKEKANELLQKARSGQPFKQIAAADNGIQYIDLDWRTASELPSIFSKQVPSMKKAEIAGPVSAPNGFHLLKLLEKRGEAATMLTLDQAKNILFQQKVSKKIEEWVAQARKSAYVKVMD